MTASMGKKISKNTHERSRCMPTMRGYALPNTVRTNSLAPLSLFSIFGSIGIFHLLHAQAGQLHEDIFQRGFALFQAEDFSLLAGEGSKNTRQGGILLQHQVEGCLAIGALDVRFLHAWNNREEVHPQAGWAVEADAEDGFVLQR